MAKFIKSTLPKIISRANKDISAIIESDLIKEGNLLKKLVDHVAKSNKQLSKDREYRMQETKEKIDQYDQEVEKLNQEINDIDHETLIRQLNQMLRTKEDVFLAKQSLRFYEAQKLPKTIDLLKEQTTQIQTDLLAAQKQILSKTFTFTTSANQFFIYMHHAASKITHIMSEEFIKKAERIQADAQSLESLKATLFKNESSIEELRENILKTLNKQSLINKLNLYNEHSDAEIDEYIESEFSSKKEQLTNELHALQETYSNEQKEIKDAFFTFEQRMSKELHLQHQELIDQEATDREDIKEQLKNIKFAMMEAEKKQNYRQVKSLIRQYDKTEQRLSESQVSRVEDELEKLTLKEHQTTLQKLYQLETKYIKEKSALELELAIVNIHHEKDKHHYLLQTDYDQLLTDKEEIKTQFTMIKEFYSNYLKAKTSIIKNRLTIRLEELKIIKEHESSKITFTQEMDELIEKLSKQINQYISQIILLEKQKYENMVDAIFQIKQSLLKIDLEKQLISIDHRIVNRKNEQLIQTEKQKDNKQQKIIVLESQIEVALKEKELQLIKVKSLYEYEKRLAEEQVSRISGGIDINDAFVKTTLENQLLFAEQQIECAKSEYEIRLESIQLTKEQEISYASQKLEEHKHHFDQEIQKLEKIRHDKLEDIEYKMMLFTSSADHRKFKKQIDELNHDVDQKIATITKQIDTDHQIARYQEMIDKADARFERAKEDAQVLRDQTIASFQSLYNKTKAKFDDMEETSHSEESKNLTPVLNNQALSRAHERLEQATKEADAFYQERIKEPQTMIEEYRAEIDALAGEDYEDDFIQKQLSIKKELKVEFASNEELIHAKANEEKEQFTTSFNALVTKEFDKTTYIRTDDEIQKSYLKLEQQEQKRAHQYEEELRTLLTEEQKVLDRIARQYDNEFSSLIKSYKVYLRTASKGILKQEREIKKQANKNLKVSLHDAKQNLELKK